MVSRIVDIMKEVEELRKTLDEDVFYNFLDIKRKAIRAEIEELTFIEEHILTSEQDNIVEDVVKETNKDSSESLLEVISNITDEKTDGIMDTIKIPLKHDILSSIGKTSGQVVKDLPPERITPSYKLVFPPTELLDQKLNKELLEVLTPELLVFFRTFTHPFRPDPNPNYVAYLDYLIENEGWTEAQIKYLLSGTACVYKTSPFYQNHSKSESEKILNETRQYISNIKMNIDAHNQANNPSFFPIMTPEKLFVSFKRKRMGFGENLSVKKFDKTTKDFGYILEPFVYRE